MSVFQQAMGVLVQTGWPLFAVLLGVGLLVGVIQAATQINDSAVGFVPRIAAGAAAAWYLGSWMVDRWGAFLADMIRAMSGA